MKRFWDKVQKTDNCWNWTAGSRGGRYGAFKYKGRVYDAHRFVWFLVHGYFPERLVCHTCDNPSCVNIDHLFLGSSRDNVLDAMKKGRMNPSFPKKERQHGRTMYNHGCRCEVCYTAQQKHNAQRNREAHMSFVDISVHNMI